MCNVQKKQFKIAQIREHAEFGVQVSPIPNLLFDFEGGLGVAWAIANTGNGIDTGAEFDWSAGINIEVRF
jgi:hypothetical protein